MRIYSEQWTLLIQKSVIRNQLKLNYMFPQEFVDFGYVQVDPHKGMIHVHKSRMDYQTISIGSTVAQAYWSGHSITVILESGVVQIHRDFYSFPEIIKY